MTFSINQFKNILWVIFPTQMLLLTAPFFKFKRRLKRKLTSNPSQNEWTLLFGTKLWAACVLSLEKYFLHVCRNKCFSNMRNTLTDKQKRNWSKRKLLTTWKRSKTMPAKTKWKFLVPLRKSTLMIWLKKNSKKSLMLISPSHQCSSSSNEPLTRKPIRNWLISSFLLRRTILNSTSNITKIGKN